MRLRLFFSAAALLALAACSEKSAPAAELNCQDPALLPALQQQLQQAVAQSARQFAQTDSRQFVDADKIIAAASQLQLALQDVQTDHSGSKPVCSARLSATIPAAVWQQAEANTPILYPQKQLTALLQGQLNGTGIQLQNGSLSMPLRYTPAAPAAASAAAPVIEPPGLAQLAHTLGNALLPYGVKDIIVVNGKALSRAEALSILSNPNAAVDAPTPDALKASAILNGAEASAAVAPSPAENEALAEARLQQARQSNQQANDTINRLWRNLDDLVREELQAEQSQWVRQKTGQCGDGDGSSQGEYQRLECDTRLTQERIQYLRGFSVP